MPNTVVFSLLVVALVVGLALLENALNSAL